jgi:hypothetical protein
MGWLKRLFNSKISTATLLFVGGVEIIVGEDKVYLGREERKVNEALSLDNLVIKEGNKINIKSHPMTQKVSRKHAVLTKESNNEYSITDQGSNSGTFVNEIKLVPGTKRSLSNHDKVELCGIGKNSIISFQILY